MTSSQHAYERRWFVDEDLLGLAKTLEAAKFDIVHPGHADWPGIPRRTVDADWIRIAGEHGWPVFTHDNRILKEPATAALLRQSPTVVFFLLGRDESTWYYVRMVAKHWDRIAAGLKEAEAGGKRHYTVNMSRVAWVLV